MTADVTIVGAGPVGTLMALLLAARGRRVRVLERRPDPRTAALERGRSINLALAARGMIVLEQAGVLARIGPHLTSMAGRLVHDEQGGRRLLPYGQNEREVIYSVSREQLTRCLIEAAADQAAIELHFGCRCVDLQPAARRVRVQDRHGRLHDQPFELLLAADGAGSAVRAALAAHGAAHVHEEELTHDYKELMIPPASLRAAGAADPLAETHALHIWPRGGFMLIALPNADGSFTATLFLARHGQPGFEALSRETGAVTALFRRHFADVIDCIPDLEGQFREHPQGRLGTVHCTPWNAAGRVLLIGDAAHAIVPFHGQGLNCGFEDCRLLDERLAGAAADGDPAASTTALAGFEAARRPDTEAIAAMALENYVEMRDSVRSAQFAPRRALAAALERRFPDRFIPRYSMVMFHPEIPYAEARRRGERQAQLLDELIARRGTGPLDAAELEQARGLLDRHAL